MPRFSLLAALTVLVLALHHSQAAEPPNKRNIENPDVDKLAQDNNQFACNLYNHLRTQPGNLFFSPHSLSTALGMTFAGAKGETETEMAEVLHFKLPQNRLHTAFSALSTWLHGANRNGIEIRTANRLWGQKGDEFLPAYLKVTRELYGAELGLVDFVGEAEAARQAINTWVESQTNQKIQNLIPPGVLNALTRLVLTNAIYFKGDWASPFPERLTQDAPFHLSADKSVDVPMMFQKKSFRYAAVAEVQVLELPYAGNDLAMLVLLPEEVEGLAVLEEKLTPEALSRWASSLRKQEVRVYLPKFTMTSQFNLRSVLQEMGLASAFDPDRADFSGMTGTRELFISEVIHKAFVDVGEKGTEAAAATGVVIGVTSAPIEEPPTFRADHPFLFLIRDTRTQSILFMGRVTDPSR